MNRAPEDTEPVLGRVRLLPLYQTAIGDAIFPGDDFHTIRLRSDFNEMLLHHLRGGGVLDLMAIGETLAEFTPERVSTTTHPAWKDSVTEEWAKCERQRMFLVALQTAGIRFGDTAQLIDRMLHSGNWREAFIKLAEMGRQHGIQLSGNNIDRRKVAEAFHGAGFSQVQQHLFWCNFHEGNSA